jgi:hypothetical protein
MAGRRWLQNPSISRLTLRPDQVPSALPEITRANSNQHSRRHQLNN